MKDIFGNEMPVFSGEILLHHDINLPEKALKFKTGETLRYEFFKEDNHFILYILHNGKEIPVNYYQSVSKFKEDKAFKILKV